MTDTATRNLTRTASTDEAAARALLRAEERAGGVPYGPSLPQPLVLLERLVAAGEEPQRAREHVSTVHGIDRMPRGSGDAIQRGTEAMLDRLLGEARGVRLTHRTAGQALSALAAALDSANGQRRARTLCLDGLLADVAQAADGRELRDYGREGGRVPNSYRYPATQTATTVVRYGSRVAIWVRECGASRGSSTSPWNCTGGDSQRAAMLRAARLAPVVISCNLARGLVAAAEASQGQ